LAANTGWIYGWVRSAGATPIIIVVAPLLERWCWSRYNQPFAVDVRRDPPARLRRGIERVGAWRDDRRQWRDDCRASGA
jgi:hypothetical protein